MILAGDVDALVSKILHRMIGAMMAELHLDRAGAGCQGQ